MPLNIAGLRKDFRWINCSVLFRSISVILRLSVESQYTNDQFNRLAKLSAQVVEWAPPVAREGIRISHQSATHLRGAQLQAPDGLSAV